MNTKVQSLPLTIFSSILPITIVNKHEMAATRRLNDNARKPPVLSSNLLYCIVCTENTQIVPQPNRQRDSELLCLITRSKSVHGLGANFGLFPIKSAYNQPHGSRFHCPLRPGRTLALISITQARTWRPSPEVLPPHGPAEPDGTPGDQIEATTKCPAG